MMDAAKQLRWDRHFLHLAREHGYMSKDPSTKVGAVIVGPDLELRSAGFNGFPRNIEDTPERLHNRAHKYRLVVHAELNAILAAARVGIGVKGCSLYIVARRADSTDLWGGPPCIRCTVEILQAGITSIIGTPKTFTAGRWNEDGEYADLAASILAEAGVSYREVGF